MQRRKHAGNNEDEEIKISFSVDKAILIIAGLAVLFSIIALINAYDYLWQAVEVCIPKEQNNLLEGLIK